MTAAWIVAVAAVVGMAVTAGTVILHMGRVEGRVAAVLEQLGKIVEDHEERIRQDHDELGRLAGVRRWPHHG